MIGNLLNTATNFLWGSHLGYPIPDNDAIEIIPVIINSTNNDNVIKTGEERGFHAETLVSSIIKTANIVIITGYTKTAILISPLI